MLSLAGTRGRKRELSSKILRFFSFFWIVVSGGCAMPFGKELHGFDSPGRWEEVRRIAFGQISSDRLDGDIGPAYLLFSVTVAGFHDARFGLAAGPDDDVRYTTDGGESWTRASGELHCRHGVEIVNERVAWHCGNGGTRLSTDGGRTWTTVSPSGCPNLSFLDAQTGWASSNYQLQATEDGGRSWRLLASPAAEGGIMAVALRTKTDGYVLDKHGRLFVTSDGGESWEERSLGLTEGESLVPSGNGPRAALRFPNERNGIAVYDLLDRSVWFAVTADGGRTWKRSEIPALRDGSFAYQIYLSRDGRWLTVTDDFNNGTNTGIVFQYV
ncbi:MAG: hypothetical protein JW929_06030 [Anaerolineales bacterium]|nr:hypothetical protein [Anaerolineales bacterium]